jgi:hypothetical protein
MAIVQRALRDDVAMFRDGRWPLDAEELTRMVEVPAGRSCAERPCKPLTVQNWQP